MSRYILGRLLELIGLLVVPFGLLLGMAGHITTHLELLFLGVGGAIFLLGNQLERKRRS